MANTFVPAGTFGRYALRKIFEQDNTTMAVQLLNVPTSTPGDRSTWTWQDNWSQYAISGMFTGNSGRLDLRSTATSPPSSIAVVPEADAPLAGAYYDGEYVANYRYFYIGNFTGSTITYTHAAFFISQPTGSTLSTLAEPNLRCIFVAADNNTETTDTIANNSYLFFPFGLSTFDYLYGGAAVSISSSFEDWVKAEETYIEDGYTGVYPFIYDYTKIYHFNTANDTFFSRVYRLLNGATADTAETYFLAELLNVTAAEPDFDAGWAGWSTYRIERYATSTALMKFNYENKSDSWYWEDADITFTYDGVQMSLKSNLDFVFGAPASGSYTYTHIAIFIAETSTAPPANFEYTYADPDKFLGVIKLDSSVTMTTASTAKGYPFNLSFMISPAAGIA